MAVIIKPNGTKEYTEPSNGSVFSLEELQKVVGGYIQLVSITAGGHSGKLMVVNEEGLIRPSPILNEEASKIAGQQIVGSVIIIDREQIK